MDFLRNYLNFGIASGTMSPTLDVPPLELALLAKQEVMLEIEGTDCIVCVSRSSSLLTSWLC